LRNVQELINNFMEERIVIGFIVSLVASTAFWVWSSDFFTKTQKILITISLILPPGALFVIILISIYNKIKKSTISGNTSAEDSNKNDFSTLTDLLTKVKELHSKGVFSDSELAEKISEIEKQIRARERDKVLQNVELKVKLSEEYRALEMLRESRIIEAEEFDRKVKHLIDNKSIHLSPYNEDEKSEVKSSKKSNDGMIYFGVYVLFLICLIIYAVWFNH